MKNLDAVYAEKIAAEYTVKPASKLVALKKLDRRARRAAELFAYIFGIAGALILGTGMSLCMGVIPVFGDDGRRACRAGRHRDGNGELPDL